jgi:hypothetical protein
MIDDQAKPAVTVTGICSVDWRNGWTALLRAWFAEAMTTPHISYAESSMSNSLRRLVGLDGSLGYWAGTPALDSATASS